MNAVLDKNIKVSAHEKLSTQQLWEMGISNLFLGKASNLASFRGSIANFKLAYPQVANKYLTVEQKRTNHNGMTRVTMITNVPEFIKVYNDNFGKIIGKINTGWSGTAIDCYNNKGECSNCFYAKVYDSLKDKCKMKSAVITLAEKFGPPAIKDSMDSI